MNKLQLLALTALLGCASLCEAHPRVGISLGFGFAPPFYAPYYRPYYPYGYYRPYSVVVQPAPILVTQPVVVQQPGVVVSQAPPPAPSQQPSLLEVTPTPGVVRQTVNQRNVDMFLTQLKASDENVRRDAAMELGRMKAEAAMSALTSILANDPSPSVRDAAARALGLIGSPRALEALGRAGLGDSDRDVRHSAQFASEVIRSQLRRD